MSSSTVFLSIIFPAYNEEERIKSTLDKTIKFLINQPYSSEIIVVENGSSDGTFLIASSFIDKFPKLKVLREDEKGKGLAVKRGMLEAVGQFRFICDVDLSMPIEEVNRFIPPVMESEITIASREAPGARRYNEPEYRHLIGRVLTSLSVCWQSQGTMTPSVVSSVFPLRLPMNCSLTKP